MDGSRTKSIATDLSIKPSSSGSKEGLEIFSIPSNGTADLCSIGIKCNRP